MSPLAPCKSNRYIAQKIKKMEELGLDVQFSLFMQKWKGKMVCLRIYSHHLEKLKDLVASICLFPPPSAIRI